MMYGTSTYTEKITKPEYKTRNNEYRRNDKLRTKKIRAARKFKQQAIMTAIEDEYGELN